MGRNARRALPVGTAVIEVATVPDKPTASASYFYPVILERRSSGYLQPVYFSATRRNTGSPYVRYRRRADAVDYLTRQQSNHDNEPIRRVGSV